MNIVQKYKLLGITLVYHIYQLNRRFLNAFILIFFVNDDTTVNLKVTVIAVFEYKYRDLYSANRQET